MLSDVLYKPIVLYCYDCPLVTLPV